ncbi:MAG: phage tail sheath C-terminal domain-containing protein, partial [Blastocatellia bacterium]
AGVSYVLRDVVALETDNAGIQMDDITQGTLNLNGIDVARNFSQEGYGIVHWAARTISNNPLYTFLQVRVIFNVIAVSVKRGLKPYVFRAIDGKGKLADEITAQLNQFLFNMWDADILFGDTPGDAFNVVVNTSNLSLLEQAILQISIYAKPAPIAERIAVTQFRVPLSFDFKTGQIDVGTLQLNQTA